jgi:hypothetical protein
LPYPMIARVERVVDTPDPRAELVDRTRGLFRNGLTSGKPYPPLPPGTGATFLRGLLTCRLVATLTQPELAQRAGIARETLSRLERLRRPAQPENSRGARALGVSAQLLTTPTEQLAAVLHPAGDPRPSGGDPVRATIVATARREQALT